ncbi:MAG: hypothetical protein KDK56_08205 [Simkania sp.]|nr:hypothetical protein [Simkania sp.]MCB1076175.1 hypothetical protein [Simkania sp.]MCP5491034.1 hypothetical protein [Chlamydiales bacterium]
MAVQQFQCVRYTTTYLFDHVGIEHREPFIPNDRPYGLPPIQEIEIQFPKEITLTDDTIRKLVNQWIDVVEAECTYIQYRMAYVFSAAPVDLLTYDSVDISTAIGVRFKEIWTNFKATKERWKAYKDQGFSIQKTQ